MLRIRLAAVAVPAMVQQMHQRTSGQQQEWQKWDYMCSMFGDQEEQRDRDKAEEDIPRDSAPSVAGAMSWVVMLHRLAPNESYHRVRVIADTGCAQARPRVSDGRAKWPKRGKKRRVCAA